MNWVKENKFLTGFILVLLIGVGVLGYEVLSASSAYDETSDAYTKASGEYNRLRHLVPFPNKQNLEEYEKQEEAAKVKIDAFEADLAKKEFPLEPMTPEGFQDKLKASVTEIRKKAADSGILLPEKEKGSYIGFERYEATPPPPDAAAPLGRELKAIEWVLNQYLAQSSAKMQKIVSLVRTDLPEERPKGGPGGKGGGPGGAGKGGPGGGGGGSSRRDLVKYHPFDIDVICKPAALREVLDAVTSSKAPQFFVLRQIRIKNEHEKPPSRTVEAAAADKPTAMAYIVGEEWIEVLARWEVVDFASPSDKLSKEKAELGQPGSTPKPGPGSRPGSGPRSTPPPQ